MKRIAILFALMMPLALLAQKPLKPNLNKALTSWKTNKLDEAKAMIDVCVVDPKLMNDSKAWYYRGLIYASLDTTSNATFKGLESNAFEKSLEAFAKAEELNKSGKSELFYQDDFGLPVLKSQSILGLGYFYLNAGANAYQDDDLDVALMNFEKTIKVLPTDTLGYFYGGFVAQAMENYDKSIAYLSKYNELGGTSPDAYAIIINTYSGPKNDKEKALQVAREAKAKFPNNTDFPKTEIGLLIDMDKIDDARKGLESAIKSEPDNKILHFYLGYVNSRMEKYEDAKVNFNAALKIDPMYFEAQYYLAQVYLIDAEKVRKEMDNLGISAADKKKKVELDNVLVEKYKIALPYWEKAEKLNPSDTDVLDKLSVIYYYLGEDAKAARVNKRLKELGIDEN